MAKARVAGALLMLIAAKIFVVRVPFFFKRAVDALAGTAPQPAVAAAWMVAYGLARATYTLLQEGRVPAVRAGGAARAPPLRRRRLRPPAGARLRLARGAVDGRALARLRARRPRDERDPAAARLQRRADGVRGAPRARDPRPRLGLAVRGGGAALDRALRLVVALRRREARAAAPQAQRRRQPHLHALLQRAPQQRGDARLHQRRDRDAQVRQPARRRREAERRGRQDGGAPQRGAGAALLGRRPRLGDGAERVVGRVGRDVHRRARRGARASHPAQRAARLARLLVPGDPPGDRRPQAADGRPPPPPHRRLRRRRAAAAPGGADARRVPQRALRVQRVAHRGEPQRRLVLAAARQEDRDRRAVAARASRRY